MAEEATILDTQIESQMPAITVVEKMSGKFHQVDKPKRLLDRIIPSGDGSSFIITPEKKSEECVVNSGELLLDRSFGDELPQVTIPETPSLDLPYSSVPLDTKYPFVPKKSPRYRKGHSKNPRQSKEHPTKRSSEDSKGKTYSDVLKHGMFGNQDFHKAEPN